MLLTPLKFLWKLLSKDLFALVGQAYDFVTARPPLQRAILAVLLVISLVWGVSQCRGRKEYKAQAKALATRNDSLVSENNRVLADAQAARDNAFKLQLRNDTLRKKDSLTVSRLSPAERTAVNRQLLTELQP